MNHTEIFPHFLFAEDFYTEVKQKIKSLSHNESSITLLSLDLDNFNYINDLFSYEIGDLTLEQLTKHFSSLLHEDEFFSRLHADHFLFCLNESTANDVKKRFLALTDFKDSFENILLPHCKLDISAGCILVTDDTAVLPSLLDKANYARKRAKRTLSNALLFYNEKMEEEVQWKKIVTFTMEAALANNEFEMFLQPKILLKSNEVVGAEALVRWRSPQYGLVYPDKFIPIMEQNGFIRRLDFFMLEEACRFLQKNEENGIQKYPISVNFSKVHLTTDHLAEKIFQTVTQLGISPNLIEIEFTESLYVESFENLFQIITDLKLLGFKVSLDDFGNSYSSLSYLKDLPLDIIKIDKGFLSSSSNTEKGKVIISKVIELIKSLHMLSVMEGVETNEQQDFLQKMSCDIAQGFYYARPLPAEDYLDYIKNDSLLTAVPDSISKPAAASDHSHLHTVPHEFEMDNWELYILGKNIDMGLMKGYLDGEATVQYINDRALEYLGCTRLEFREIFNNSIIAFTHPDDVAIVQKNAEQLIKTGVPLQFQTRAVRKDGKVIILQGRSSCAIDNNGRPIGLYAFQDVTEEQAATEALRLSLESKIEELKATIESERQTKEALKLSEERYRIIVDQSDDIMFEWDFETDSIHFSNKFENMFGFAPICNNLTDNKIIRSLIHPGDINPFNQWVRNTYKRTGCSEAQYRIKTAGSEYIWIRCRSTAICDENGNPQKTIGVFSNINAQKNELDSLTLKSQCDPLTKLLNKTEVQFRIEEILKKDFALPNAFFIIDIDNFKGINDNLGHQLGDAVLTSISDKIQETFSSSDIIGRIGGDEIAVFMRNCTEESVREKAVLLNERLHSTYYGSTSQFNISGSIGISLCPAHGSTFADLYHYADIALYESKNNGKDQYTIYSSDMTGSLVDNRTPVDWNNSFLNTYFKNDFPFTIFDILYDTRDISLSVDMILELLGKRYDVDRVYIFQQDKKDAAMSNTYEWCAPGVSSEIKFLQNLPLEQLSVYFSQYNEEGVYCCTDIQFADKPVFDLCAPQGIKSFLHCALYNERELTGFIGFDVCKDYHQWSGEEIATLGYIARILSVFLTKTLTESELRSMYKNYVEMLDNLNGFVYVIDPETHQVLYVNNATKSFGWTPGKTCYKMAFGNNAPCKDCPINHFSDTVHYSIAEIYSDLLKGWVHSAASRLKWSGTKDAVLVCCTDISKYKK